MARFALRIVLLACICFITALEVAQAHFGIIVPSRSMVTNRHEAAVKLDIAFAHPFSQTGMTMARPREAFVVQNGEKTALDLVAATYLGKPAFVAEYNIARPGVYQFATVPEPYYEPAEGRHIVHYAKTVIGAFGYEDGWADPVGLPVEIVPLSRPFGNYAGNVFCGLALKNGRPLAHADVEVEFLNAGSKRKAANPYFETQLVRTDANGEFVFGIPWPGWWGFAALTDGDEEIEHEGAKKPVELGGIIWVEFSATDQDN